MDVATPPPALRPSVGLLPQHPTAPDGLTVAELVARGRHPHRGVFQRWSAADTARVDDAMARPGSPRSPTGRWATCPADSASASGSRWPSRRSPRILLLDEPTTFLDLSHQIEVLDLLRELNRTDGTTIVVVLHELNLAARYADDLVVMTRAASSRTATPSEVLTREVVSQAFALDALVIPDPFTQTPLVIPVPGGAHASADGLTPPKGKTRMPASTARLGALAALTAAGASSSRGCAGTPAPERRRRRRRRRLAAFPVTIEHMYGETTIESRSERIATWGWGATDAVLALGIVPVAISSMDYGGGDNRITPWVEEAIEDLGGEEPVILDNATFELSVEELLAADPDVLIAPYSGLTQEEYDAVTGPASRSSRPRRRSGPRRGGTSSPRRAGPRAWMTRPSRCWPTSTQQVADAAAEHPEFAGTTIAYAADDVDTFYLYLPADPRVEILEDLGFVTAEA